jgi:alanyl aminopeptidase
MVRALMNTTRFVRSVALCLCTLVAACGGSTAEAPPAAAVTTGGGGAPDAAPAPAAKLEPPAFRLPNTIAPTGYAATLSLDPDAEMFSGSIEIGVELTEATSVVWLHGRDLTVKEASATSHGSSIAATLVDESSDDFIGLALGQPIGPGPATLSLSYDGKASDTELSGVFRQKEVDDWYLFTQFEAIDARRAFPCFDEPQFKVPWQLALRVKNGQRAFANTPELSVNDGGDGWETHSFARSKPLPSYLVAFAVGPFDVVDAGKAGSNETPLRIIVPRGKQAEARYAVEATGQILSALEAYFDIPYPYAKLDSIVVPNFFGAMENPGLITYAMPTILHDPATETPGFHRRYAGIAAHEIAHQWFGNLVTMQWWDDLWLNESFATWMAAKIVNQWKPEWGGEVYFVSQRERAMQSDALPAAKQIRLPVESRADLFGGGSAIIYAKGSSVLTTFEEWIGEDEFRAGIRSYMNKHAWGNATAADFLAALSAQSTPELAAAFATFIDQPGFPLVTASLECEKGGTPKLVLSQERYVPTGAQLETGADALWKLPVCATYDGGRDCTLMDGKTAELELSSAKSCPKWVLANDNAAGYYRVAYEGDLLQKNLLGAGAKKLSLVERIMLIGDASALVDNGRMSPADAFTMVPKVLSKDRNVHVVSSTTDIVASVDGFLVEDALRPNYARFIRKMYGKQASKLGWKTKQGEDDDTRMLRPQLLGLVALLGEDKKLIAQATALAGTWLDDETAVDPDLAGTVLSIAARHGDQKLYDRLLAEAKATVDRKRRGRLLGALAQFSDPKLVAQNLDLMLGDSFEFREAATLMQAPLQNPTTREVAYTFIKDNFDAIIEKLPSFYGRFIVYSAAAFCDEAHIEDAKAFFGPKVKDMMGGPAALEQVVQTMQICAAKIETQRPSVSKFLKKY